MKTWFVKIVAPFLIAFGLISGVSAQDQNQANNNATPDFDPVVGGGVTVRPFDYLGDEFQNQGDSSDAVVPDYILTLRAQQLSGRYDLMAQSLAKVLAYATSGQIVIRTEVGLNSTENMQQSAERTDLFFFMAMARDVDLLRTGSADWGADHPYQLVRSVVSLPPIVLHIVTQSNNTARTLRDMSGTKIYADLPGTLTRRIFDDARAMLPTRDKLEVVDTVAGDDPLVALRRRDIDAFAIASPMPNMRVQDLSKVMQLGLVGYAEQDHQYLLESEPQLITRLIPAHTYTNVEFDVKTIAEPVGIYTQQRMLAEPVQALVKAYWLWRKALIEGAAQPWWADTDTADIANLIAPLHPAAVDYYDEAGVILPATPRPN